MAVISQISSKQKNKEAGFTLVEVLCVLALLGLTAGLVVLNLPKPAPPIEAEMQKLTGLLNLAVRQSVIDGKSRGVDVTQTQLEIYGYDGEWTLEHQQEFVDVNELELTVDGQEVNLKSRDRRKEKEALPPLIYFDAVGNVTPFLLSLEGEQQSYSLAPDERGRVVLETEK